MGEAPGSIDRPERAKEQIVDHVSSSGEAQLTDLKEVTGLELPSLFALTNELVAEKELIHASRFGFRTPQPEGEAEESGSPEAATATEEAAPDSTQSSQDDETVASSSAPPSDTQSGRNRGQWQSAEDEEQSIADLYQRASTKEQAWGAVLIFVALPLIGVAVGSIYAVYAGGFLGILSARMAVILGTVLAVIGGIGLIQGVRAYRGMRS